MAKFDLLIKHTKKWEGNHGADPRDNALKYGHSGVLGKAINPRNNQPYDKKYPNNYVHTSSGVIWGTYLEYCKLKKKIPTAAEFLYMDEKMWKDIYKTLFWDKLLADNIYSQGIAENLMEAQWIGGGSNLVKDTVNYLNKNFNTGLSITGKMNNKIVDALNKNINSKDKYLKILKYLYDSRLIYYKGRADWVNYGNGWTNRLNELYNRSLKYPFSVITLSWIFKLFSIGMFFF